MLWGPWMPRFWIEITLHSVLAFPHWLLGASLSELWPPHLFLSGLYFCQLCSSEFGTPGQCHCQPWSVQWAAPSSTVLKNASFSLLWHSSEDKESWQDKTLRMTHGKLVAREDAIWGLLRIFYHLVPLQRVIFPRCWLSLPPSSRYHIDVLAVGVEAQQLTIPGHKASCQNTGIRWAP